MRPTERDAARSAVQRGDFPEALRQRRRLGRAAYLLALLADSGSDDDQTGKRAAATGKGLLGMFSPAVPSPAR